MALSLNLIGPGRAGLSLAKALTKTSQYSVRGVFHPDITKGKKAVNTLKTGQPYHQIGSLPPADLTCIATPDDRIENIITQLCEQETLKPGSLVFHLSGILSLDVLAPIAAKGALIASLHPLKAFSRTSYLENHPFEYVNCAIENNNNFTSKQMLFSLAHAIKAEPFDILSSQKVLYHTAAIMASNYLVTLAHESIQILSAAGIKAEKAHQLCTHLMQSSLNNVKHTSAPRDALTGPIARGDLQTIKKHLAHIKNQTTKNVYCHAGIATVDISPQAAEIKQVLKTCFTAEIEKNQ